MTLDSSFYGLCVETLSDCIEKFSDDLNKIDNDDLKKRLKKISQDFNFKEDEIDNNLLTRFKKIAYFYLEEKKRFSDKTEDEYKDIIKLLTDSFLAFTDDNREFSDNVDRHGDNLLEIKQLDDIKQIREHLENEVFHIKKILKEKKESDTKQIKALSEKIDVLQRDLKNAESIAKIDKLTGTYNRHAFDSHIKNLVGKTGLCWSTFSVIMLDIDNFKKVNDTYGHLVGDRVIVKAVEISKSFLRKNDFIARYGGEEFVIILHAISLKNATKKANGICEAIRNTRVAVDENNPEVTLNFTISAGVSKLDEVDNELTVINRADKALYLSKQGGKDMVSTEKMIRNESKSILK